MNTPAHDNAPEAALARGIAHFEEMIDRAYDVAEAAHNAGKPIVGILCEYTPRELIFAAGGLPVCLCGGSAETIPAAERDLPAGLCPLIKSSYGYLVQHVNPFLEWADLVVAETTCDGKKKMYELMAQQKTMYVLELPQKTDDPDARIHFRREMHKLKAFLEARYNVEITHEKLKDAVKLMNAERAARLRLARVMALPNPPITGAQLLEFKSILSGIPEDLKAYDDLNEALSAIEAKGDSDKPRILLTGVPTPHGAERVLNLIEDSGALVVVQENCTGVKPLLTRVDENAPDLIDELADHYFHLPCSVLTDNKLRTDNIAELCRIFHVEGVIDLVYQGCLTYDVEAYHVKRKCEEELHLPYLKIVTDYSDGDSERLRTRIEAMLELIRDARKQP